MPSNKNLIGQPIIHTGKSTQTIAVQRCKTRKRSGITYEYKCRLCGCNRLRSILNLGSQFVNDFVTADVVQREYAECVVAPVHMVQCQACKLCQLRHTVPGELLYRGTYWYKSGVTSTMRDELESVVHHALQIMKVQGIPHRNYMPIFLDIGSNDGTMLRYVNKEDQHGGFYTIGVEPASNLSEEGAKGVDLFIKDMWSFESYSGVTTKLFGSENDSLAHVITAIGMMYDLEDPHKFIADIKKVLHPEGVFILQLMCLATMLSTNDVGNLTHEHLEFYTLKNLDDLFKMNGLKIVDVKLREINNGSYRIVVRHEEYPENPGMVVNTMMAFDEQATSDKILRDWPAKLFSIKRSLVEFIDTEVKLGKKVWCYGASTKGNCILQFLGLDSSHIQGASERSLMKHDLYTVGTGIRIYSEEYARQMHPDYMLVLPYTFIDEFITREEDYLSRGGVFIVPFPLPYTIRYVTDRGGNRKLEKRLI